MTGPLAADVFVDEHLPAGGEDALVAALAAFDIRTRTRAAPVRRAGELQWIVLIALPLQAFLSTAGGRLAEDAYRRLKDAVRGLTGRDNARDQVRAGPIVLQDPATGLQIVLDRGLPEAALDQLRGLDLTEFGRGPLHYDRHERRWRSTADEADRRSE